MIRPLWRSCTAMLRAAWRTNPAKIALGLVLMAAGGAAWPLLALALKSAMNAAVHHDATGATEAGLFVGATAIGALILQHFAYVPYAESAEMAVVELEAELMTLANGSAGLEHHEQAEYADKISVLQRELSQFHDGMLGLMALIALSVSMTTTAVLLAFLDPLLLLLPIAALPPLIAGQRAQSILSSARERCASQTRQSFHLLKLATGAGPAKEIRVFRLRNELRRRHRDLWRKRVARCGMRSCERPLSTEPARSSSPPLTWWPSCLCFGRRCTGGAALAMWCSSSSSRPRLTSR